MKGIFLLILLLPFIIWGEEYAFRGKHLIASYYDCEESALHDLEELKKILLGAASESGATILDHVDYHFEPNGLTMVVLLSESHASLHTYPEHGACFIDLFTCGDSCCADRFDQYLRGYLKPKHVTKELIERS